ncbi:MAG: peptidoglycan editing factor PgeF [Bacteroidaceae bacterium]|nr:peptidoglycan editing factor PgeF [Bacteroidaceae bacterium]
MAKLLKYKTREDVFAFSTYRGEGTGSYGGFNITHYCGDTALHVEQCREELCKELGIDDSHLILPRQTHSDKVAVIDSHFLQLSNDEQYKALQGIDAIVTALPHICIGVSTADCIPVLLHDAKRNVIAAIHAGWRGTVAMIVCKVIDKMNRLYGSCACDIDAIIGPGISLDAFEVGDEVYEEFCKAGFAMQQIAKRYPATEGGEKWHIDLWEANSLLLQQCSVARENIHIAGVCTYKNHNDFFSARRLGIKSGRIFSGILLKPCTVG